MECVFHYISEQKNRKECAILRQVMKMSYLGVDIGSTSCKAALYSADGSPLAKSVREYGGNSLEKGMLDAKELSRAVLAAIREVVGKRPHDGVEAVSATSFGECVVLLDSDGEPVAPIELYIGQTGTAECAELCERLGTEQLLQITGVMPHPMYALPRLMALKKRQPDVFARVRYILPVADYLIFLLCARAVSDPSLASRTMALDVHTGSWSQSILEAAGISQALFPQVLAAGTVAGRVSARASEMTGLPENAAVVVGAHDQICAAIGCGAFEPGTAVDGSGTVECVIPIMDAPMPPSATAACGYACVPYLLPGQFTTYAFSFTGALLQWFRDRFVPELREVWNAEGKNAFAELDAAIPDCAQRLLVLPYFAGAATPYQDAAAEGAIVGMTLQTDRMQIYRGILESVAFEMRLNIELLQQYGVRITQLLCTGGGAASPTWVQMKADITGIPCRVCENADSGTVGCAILSHAALHGSLQNAAASFVRYGRRFEPDGGKHEQYGQAFARYKKLYPAIHNI